MHLAAAAAAAAAAELCILPLLLPLQVRMLGSDEAEQEVVGSKGAAGVEWVPWGDLIRTCMMANLTIILSVGQIILNLSLLLDAFPLLSQASCAKGTRPKKFSLKREGSLPSFRCGI